MDSGVRRDSGRERGMLLNLCAECRCGRVGQTVVRQRVGVRIMKMTSHSTRIGGVKGHCWRFKFSNIGRRSWLSVIEYVARRIFANISKTWRAVGQIIVGPR